MLRVQDKGKGSCDKEGITYPITCNNCDERDIVGVHHGETSKNPPTRGKKYIEDLYKKIDAHVATL